MGEEREIKRKSGKGKEWDWIHWARAPHWGRFGHSRIIELQVGFWLLKTCLYLRGGEVITRVDI